MTDLAVHLMLLQKPVSTRFLKTNRIIYGRMTSGLLAVLLSGAYSSCRPSSKKRITLQAGLQSVLNSHVQGNKSGIFIGRFLLPAIVYTIMQNQNST